MANISGIELEIRATQRAYDELKCLDPDGRMRAIEWLQSKFADDEQKGRQTREKAARERIKARGAQRDTKP